MPPSRFLVVGSGYVAGPALEYLVSRGHQVTLAGADLVQMRALVARLELDTCELLELDVTKEENCTLHTHVARHDAVISLVPASMHMPLACACLAERRHLVTASYVSDDMRALDAEAREADVALLNECGLDPGLDHASAVLAIARLHETGHVVTSFASMCGALPAPEVALKNPLRYKFGWSVRGALKACLNEARWLEQGHEKTSAQLFGHALKFRAFVEPCFTLEAYPNRDAMPYIELYGLGGASARDHLTSFERFTLRYIGFSDLMHVLIMLGLLDDNAEITALTWRDYVYARLGGGVADDVRATFNRRFSAPLWDALSELGLLSDVPLKSSEDVHSPLDALCAHLGRTLAYESHERDAIYMQHEIEYKSVASLSSRVVISLVMQGSERHSAIALTVGRPAAVAAELLAQGHIKSRGVLVPSDPHIARKLIEALKLAGITFVESHNT